MTAQIALEPKEIEQRWLVDERMGNNLSESTHKTLRIIQGYLQQEGITREIISRDGKQLLCLSQGNDEKELLTIEIPAEDAQQLHAQDLLKNMRFRFQDEVGKKGQKKAFLTIKGPKISGEALEYEYEVPLDKALAILTGYCKDKLIRKTRFHLDDNRELDWFPERKQFIAEREVQNRSEMLADLPTWAQREITNEKGYSNFEWAGPDATALAMLQNEQRRLGVMSEETGWRR